MYITFYLTKKTTVFIIYLFVAFLCVLCEPIVPPIEKDLIEGNCENASLADMVFQDHALKPAIPLLYRTATISWHGDSKIYCVMAQPQDGHEAESMIIREGGVNHTFVTVEIRSKRNEGVNYYVQVFGKKLKT